MNELHNFEKKEFFLKTKKNNQKQYQKYKKRKIGVRKSDLDNKSSKYLIVLVYGPNRVYI
jgi:hypothetical protein